MPSTTKINNTYELRRRLEKGQKGLPKVAADSQAGRTDNWKKKKIRKHRKWKPKKKVSPQIDQRNEKLLDFNILQAIFCGHGGNLLSLHVVDTCEAYINIILSINWGWY